MLPVWGFWVSPVASTVTISLLFAQISTTRGCKFYSESTMGYLLSQKLCSMTDKWSTPLKFWPLLKCQLDRLLPDQSDSKSFWLWYKGDIVTVLSQECSSTCHQPQMSVIYEGDIVSVVSQECSSMCLQSWMSVIYEGDTVSVLLQECSSMCRQPWMSVIYEGDTVSVLSQECSSMCLQPWMSVIYEGDIASVLFQESSSMCRQRGRLDVHSRSTQWLVQTPTGCRLYTNNCMTFKRRYKMVSPSKITRWVGRKLCYTAN